MKNILKNSMMIASVLACLCISSVFAESTSVFIAQNKNTVITLQQDNSQEQSQEQSDRNTSSGAFREEVR